MPDLLATATDRLSALRAHMLQRAWQAVLVPSSDPHLSEYLPEHWQGREWLSGFTGSSGTLLVSAHAAALFTDSRYWEQAEAELAGTGIDLVKLDGPAVPAYVQWLRAQTTSGAAGGTGAPSVLAVDGQVLSLGSVAPLREALSAAGWALHTADDVLAGAWPDRPALPTAAVYEHLPPHAATPRRDKLAAVREALRAKGATHHWVATLDDLAWLLNLRGGDVNYNPVFISHLLLNDRGGTLFVGEGKIDAGLMERLAADGIAVAGYEQAKAALAAGADGLFIETHPDPDKALCDGPCALRLDRLEPFLAQLKQLDELVKGFAELEIR